ncbi:MAG: 3-hydroxyacyl-CoA dehydrogenase [bacterium]
MILRDKVALVTGGASGLGEATVRRFLDEGARVAILDRPGSRGAEVAASAAGRAIFVPADVTSADGVASAVAETVGKLGPLSVAVSCAGTGAALRTLTKEGPMPLDVFEMVIRVNLIGTFNVIRLAAAEMAKNAPDEGGERGVIVNTASIAAYDGQIGQAAYSASKGGVVGMTLPIARDLASLGIRCVTIAPGTFDTPMLAMLPDDARAALAAQIPFPRRLGNPAEYAALAAHVVANPMLNGETIRLDGALRMPPK